MRPSNFFDRKNLRLEAPKALFAIIMTGTLFFATYLIGCKGFITPPELSEEEILSHIDQQEVIDNFLFSSRWADEASPTLNSKYVREIVDSEIDNTPHKTAYVTTICETNQIRQSSEYLCEFILIENEWINEDVCLQGATLDCIGGISDTVLAEQAPTLMQLADEKAGKEDTASNLADLYTENFSAQVLKNNTSENNGSATISIAATKGLVTYQGTLTATFSWSGSDWEVDCSADSAAYQANYSNYEGTWMGSFVETEGWGTWNEDGACYAAKETSPALIIKEVDSVSRTAKADLSFIIHAHKDNLTNDVSTSDGDTVISLTDMLITLEPESTDFYKIVDKKQGDYEYLVFLYNDNSGNLKMRVETFKTFQTKVFDTYDLARSSQ